MSIWVVGTSGGEDFATIQGALSDASVLAGDTLQMKAEVFNETNITSAKEDITLEAHESNGTAKWIVDGGGAGTTIFNPPHGWTFRQVEIRNSTLDGIAGAVVNGSNMSIYDAYIHDVRRGVIGAQNGTFDKIVLENCQNWGLYLDENSYVKRCIAINCCTAFSGAPAIQTGRDCTVEACTVWEIPGANDGIKVGITSLVINCLVTSGGSAVNGIELGTNSATRGCYVWGSFSGAYVTGGTFSGAHPTDTTSSDAADEPQVVDAASKDYTPLRTSPHFGVAWTSSVRDDFVDNPYQGRASVLSCYDFTKASSQYISLPSSLAVSIGSGDFSVSMWAKSDDNTSVPTLFAVNDSSGNNRFIFRITANDGTLDVIDSIGVVAITSSYQFRQGVWAHLVVTYESAGKGVKIYIDGVERGSGTCTGYTGMATDDLLSIGQEYDPGPVTSNFFDGQFAQFVVWGKELNSTEVQTLMDENAPYDMSSLSLYNDIMSLYLMEEDSTSTEVIDAVGSADGTAVNMTLGPLELAPIYQSVSGAYAALSFNILLVKNLGRSSLLVIFDDAPRAVGDSLKSDMLREEGWMLTDSSGNDVRCTLASVSVVTNAIELSFSHSLLADELYLLALSDDFESTSGAAILLNTATTYGLVSPQSDKMKKKSSFLKDINVKQFPASPAAILKKTPEGGYKLSEGKDTLQKLVIRRAISKPGGFWHLPNYGANLQIKQPYPDFKLIELREQLTREILNEPEVDDVQLRIEIDNDGILIVRMKLYLNDGTDIPQTSFGLSPEGEIVDA